MFQSLNARPDSSQLRRPVEKVRRRRPLSATGNGRGKRAAIFFFQRADDSKLLLDVDRSTVKRQFRQSQHSASPGRHGVERSVDQHRDSLPLSLSQHSISLIDAGIGDGPGAGFEEIHGTLQGSKMMARLPRCSGGACRRLEHSGKRGGFRIWRFARDRIRGNSVPTKAALRNLRLQIRKSLFHPAIECFARFDHIRSAVMRRFGQEILRVVEQTHVERFQPQTIQRSSQLVRQKLRMNAMPDPFTVLHHVRVGTAGLFTSLCLLQILALHISDLGDDDDFVAREMLLGYQVTQDWPDQPFAFTVHIIGWRIDQVDAGLQGLR